MLRSAGRIAATIALTTTALVAAAPASAAFITFEEAVFTGLDDKLIDQDFPGYAGLEWDHVAATYVPGNFGPGATGWYVGVGCPTSTANMPGLPCHGAYNQAPSNTISSLSGLITLNSLNLTSPIGSRFVMITDSLGRSSGVIPLTDTKRSLIELNWTGISYFNITNVDSSGNPISAPGANWVMDNVTINAPIPEPASVVLLLAGLLAGLPFIMRRRNPMRDRLLPT
jgi:hypothetical protein